MHTRVRFTLAAAVVAAVVLGTGGVAMAAPDKGGAAAYEGSGPAPFDDVNAIARTGAAIDGVEHGLVHITATEAEVRQIRKLGFQVTAVPQQGTSGGVGIQAFPPADSGYHDYREMVAKINSMVAAHPTIMSKSTIGTSYEGRDMPLVKISDNVGTDEAEPEILFDAHQHAREHLTVEMALYIMHLLVEGYGSDTRITNLVNSREFWIVPDMNPDGGEYAIAHDSY